MSKQLAWWLVGTLMLLVSLAYGATLVSGHPPPGLAVAGALGGAFALAIVPLIVSVVTKFRRPGTVGLVFVAIAFIGFLGHFYGSQGRPDASAAATSRVPTSRAAIVDPFASSTGTETARVATVIQATTTRPTSAVVDAAIKECQAKHPWESMPTVDSSEDDPCSRANVAASVWQPYMQQIIVGNMGNITKSPYAFFVPSVKYPENQSAISRIQDILNGTVAATVLPDNMIAVGGPDSATTAQVLETAFRQATPGSFKGVVVLFMGDSNDEAAVKGVVDLSGATFRFAQTQSWSDAASAFINAHPDLRQGQNMQLMQEKINKFNDAKLTNGVLLFEAYASAKLDPRWGLPPGFVLDSEPTPSTNPAASSGIKPWEQTYAASSSSEDAGDTVHTYMAATLASIYRCQEQGRSLPNCYVDGSPKRCQQAAIALLGALDDNSRRTWTLCVESCADAGFTSRHLGECNKSTY